MYLVEFFFLSFLNSFPWFYCSTTDATAAATDANKKSNMILSVSACLHTHKFVISLISLREERKKERRFYFFIICFNRSSIMLWLARACGTWIERVKFETKSENLLLWWRLRVEDAKGFSRFQFLVHFQLFYGSLKKSKLKLRGGGFYHFWKNAPSSAS